MSAKPSANARRLAKELDRHAPLSVGGLSGHTECRCGWVGDIVDWPDHAAAFLAAMEGDRG